MREENISYYMVVTADFHQSEYVAPYFKAREFLSGFTGSNGTLVVGMERAGLWTDGRYFIQAQNELEGSGIELFRMGEKDVPEIPDYLHAVMKENETLSYDGRCVSFAITEELEKKLKANRISIRTDLDLAGDIWTDRPALPMNPMFVLDEKYAGESAGSKLSRLFAELKKHGADTYVTSRLDDLMWLYNVRGNDVDYNPVALCNAVTGINEQHFFVQTGELTDEVSAHFASLGAVIHPYEDFYSFLAEHTFSGKVLYDRDTASTAMVRALAKNNASGTASPITAMKARKNTTEILNLRRAYIEDSAAVAKMICWVKKNAGKIPMTEWTVMEHLEGLRKEIPDFVELSFGTIAAYGANAAMMHYTADEDSAAVIEPEGMLLVDSGGQYLRGTTDVTRTFAVGGVTEEMKKHYTLTAIATLRLQNAVFLEGCTGRNLDILARGVLWAHAMDYKCGTGHGIGYLLNVHEGPQNIRWKPAEKEAALEPGMIVSDEPGVYLEGRYGIRIENILLVEEYAENSDGRFLHFIPLTFVPLDRDLIDETMLDGQDREMINTYHQYVYDALYPYLDEEEREFVASQTKPFTV
ncbi:MAG: aminopeptidase P family protein [Lachnospiraceae bacterium]|nr:aminopeptidase P family protein [Lachnospiraceae bacterium]